MKLNVTWFYESIECISIGKNKSANTNRDDIQLDHMHVGVFLQRVTLVVESPFVRRYLAKPVLCHVGKGYRLRIAAFPRSPLPFLLFHDDLSCQQFVVIPDPRTLAGPEFKSAGAKVVAVAAPTRRWRRSLHVPDRILDILADGRHLFFGKPRGLDFFLGEVRQVQDFEHLDGSMKRNGFRRLP